MRDTLGTAESGAWSGGIVKAADPFSVPANASPYGHNCALALGRTGTPFVQKRMGVACRGASPLTGGEPILGQHDYEEVSTGTRRHLVTTATRIGVEATDGTFSVLGSPLTSSALPSFCTANSLAFLFNGTDAYKVRGTTIENVGIVRPVVGAMAGAAGGGGLHNGTYELRVAYKNTNTGHISSASDTAAAPVTVTNDEIDWTGVPVSPDAQVGARLLLIRNVATQAQFYVADTINDNVTTTATTSIADENLITPAPTRTSRNPPPSGVKYCTVYRGRLVVSDGEGIYWSRIDEPEAFDAFASDLIDSSGDPITGLAVDNDTLLVLKDDRSFGITGDLGGAYAITLIDATVGCVAHKTIVSAAGATYWWSRQGIVRYQGGNIDRVGMRTYGDPEDVVNMNAIEVACAVNHEARGTIYFALPDVGQDIATFILPFNYALGVLESERWDPMDVASLGLASDGVGVLVPVLGSHYGQLFQLWSTNNDGVAASTTASGTFTNGGVSVADITDSGATFDTTGNGLIGRKLTILDSDGEPVTGLLRPTITSNTATVLVFDPPVQISASGTYTYLIGGPNYIFDTPWRNFGDEWVKKRFEYLFALIKGENYGSVLTATMSFDYDSINLNGKDRTFTSAAIGAVFDTAVFDVDVFDSAQTTQRRWRVARTGKSWKVRFTNPWPNQPSALLLVSAQAVGQTVKR